MKIEGFKTPKSSFLSIEKDTDIILQKMLKNERLKRLLKYTTPNCITSCPNLTEEQSLELVGKEIRVIPRITLEPTVLNYVIINFDHYTPNVSNPYFRDNLIEISIVCHYDQWMLDNGQLRPYRIAAEIDSMLCDDRLSGLGKLEFSSAEELLISDDFGGLSLVYRTVHGDEDKKHMLPESANEQFVEEFNAMWNEG
jgi:hypothetical protein